MSSYTSEISNASEKQDNTNPCDQDDDSVVFVLYKDDDHKNNGSDSSSAVDDDTGNDKTTTGDVQHGDVQHGDGICVLSRVPPVLQNDDNEENRVFSCKPSQQNQNVHRKTLSQSESKEYWNVLSRTAIKTAFIREGGVWIRVKKLYTFKHNDDKELIDKIFISGTMLSETIGSHMEESISSLNTDDFNDNRRFTTTLKITSDDATSSSTLNYRRDGSKRSKFNIGAGELRISGDFPYDLNISNPTTTIKISTLTETEGVNNGNPEEGKRLELISELYDESLALTSNATDIVRSDAYFAFKDDPAEVQDERRRTFLGCKDRKRYDLPNEVIDQAKQDSLFFLARIIQGIVTENHHENRIKDTVTGKIQTDFTVINLFNEDYLEIVVDKTDPTKLSIKVLNL